MLPFLYPLWYVPTVNVWIWTSQKQQKSSLGRAAPFSFNCSDQSWLLQEPRANSKAHQHIFNVYPAKRTHGTNIKCKNWREDAEKSPTWQARSWLWWATCGQDILAARNSQVPPWQGVSHPQNQVCSADSEKSCVCQSPLTWSLRGSCAEIKSWGYSESRWTQSNNIILLVKPKSLCL